MDQKIRQHYDRIYAEPGHAFGGKQGSPIQSVVAIPTYVSRGTVLDLGAGQGRNALYLARHGFDVTAVDGSETGLKRLEHQAHAENLNIKTRLADVQSLDWQTSYDVLILSYVMHHLLSAEAHNMLNLMKQHTNTSGLNVIASFLNKGELFEDRISQAGYYPEPGMLRNVYSDWDILEYTEEMSRTRAKRADGSQMSNLTARLIARKP